MMGTAFHPAPGGVPAGTILLYGGSSAPASFLLCDGAAVSRTTYAGLFAAIGTSYGVGDGSTTFNVPGMAGQFARGDTPGATGGTDTIASGGAHTHGGVTGTNSASATRLTGTTATAAHTHTHAISSDGAHDHGGDNRPAFLGFQFIIKV